MFLEKFFLPERFGCLSHFSETAHPYGHPSCDMKTSITTKLPFVLHLSQHLLSPGRSLMPYEAVQISKDFGLSVASRSQRWELRPANINGVPHASLCKMSRAGGTLHPSATWIFPVAEDVGVLFLDGPLAGC